MIQLLADIKNSILLLWKKCTYQCNSLNCWRKKMFIPTPLARLETFRFSWESLTLDVPMIPWNFSFVPLLPAKTSYDRGSTNQNRGRFESFWVPVEKNCVVDISFFLSPVLVEFGSSVRSFDFPRFVWFFRYYVISGRFFFFAFNFNFINFRFIRISLFQ